MSVERVTDSRVESGQRRSVWVVVTGGEAVIAFAVLRSDSDSYSGSRSIGSSETD